VSLFFLTKTNLFNNLGIGGGRKLTPTTPSYQYPPRRGRGRAGVDSHHSLLPVPCPEGEGEGGS